MDQEYISAITSNIEYDVESFDEDSELYTYLDEEMLKFGSLRESDLDWNKAENAAIRILGEQCKHMRVLAHLSVCLQQSRDGERYLLSIKLINEFIKQHWDACLPIANSAKRTALIKQKILIQILQRSTNFSAKLDLTDGDRALLDELTLAVEQLEKNVSAIGVSYDEFWKIKSDFSKRLPIEKPIRASDSSKSTIKKEANQGASERLSSPSSSSSIASKTTEISIPELQFDLGNEREIKQTLFKVATLMNTISSSEPLGYRSRRYALWFNITSMPLEKKDGTTEMMAVSADRIVEYKEAIKRNPSEELLQMIEHSVAASPFWLNGSYLSSCVAKAIGQEEVSEAILDETLRFTKRMPGLLSAKFSDGTKFVDEETNQWLHSKEENSANNASGEWGSKLQLALGMAKKGDYKEALMLLEKGTQNAKQFRDQFYWRLATAGFMESTGMKSIAKEEYRSLLQDVKKLSVQNWEPTLIKRLQKKLGMDDLDVYESAESSAKDS